MSTKPVFLLFLLSFLLLEVCKAETRPIGPEGVEFESIEELRKFTVMEPIQMIRDTFMALS